MTCLLVFEEDQIVFASFHAIRNPHTGENPTIHSNQNIKYRIKVYRRKRQEGKHAYRIRYTCNCGLKYCSNSLTTQSTRNRKTGPIVIQDGTSSPIVTDSTTESSDKSGSQNGQAMDLDQDKVHANVFHDPSLNKILQKFQNLATISLINREIIYIRDTWLFKKKNPNWVNNYWSTYTNTRIVG